MEFETVIGLEIHAELATESKAFCPCRVTYGEKPNSFCCPVCMGLPGALPVLNKKVVQYAVMLGKSLHCSIGRYSRHSRKNYFYPDLPKGYQISQGSFALCNNGYLEVDGRKIRINRIHIEEDAGKLIHEGDITKIDYNRAGVPLVEIVTEPDLRSSYEAKEFLEKIREILLYLDISHCRMQEGNLRCDVNVSVREKGSEHYGERCEMKNINSFSGVIRSIEYEEERQKKIISQGGMVKRETRRWIDEKGESVLLRDKESCADYRYFTEPDLPPIELTIEECDEIEKNLRELPEEKRSRYIKDYGFNEYEAGEAVKVKRFTEILDEGVAAGGNPKKLYNWLVSHIARLMNEKEKDIPFTGKDLAQLTLIIERGEVSSTVGKEILEIMFDENKAPCEIVKEKGFTQITDAQYLAETVKLVLSDNPKSIADYKAGKKNAIGFLMGQCMRKTKNMAKPEVLNQILREELEK